MQLSLLVLMEIAGHHRLRYADAGPGSASKHFHICHSSAIRVVDYIASNSWAEANPSVQWVLHHDFNLADSMVLNLISRDSTESVVHVPACCLFHLSTVCWILPNSSFIETEACHQPPDLVLYLPVATLTFRCYYSRYSWLDSGPGLD